MSIHIVEVTQKMSNHFLRHIFIVFFSKAIETAIEIYKSNNSSIVMIFVNHKLNKVVVEQI